MYDTPYAVLMEGLAVGLALGMVTHLTTTLVTWPWRIIEDA
jgi:hypothetical protein